MQIFSKRLLSTLRRTVEEPDKIVALKSFDDSIEANIAKTKLDAYGIPCFLTEENLANLYPIRSPRFSVRLHVFEKDKMRAEDVLNERVMLTDEETTRCPQCRSTNIESGYSQKPSSLLLSILSSLFFVLFPPKRVNYCRDCEYEF
ncbi:DUF2007 domain-containing protein [Oscillatoria amoena NRMC-F 0135]|nr:DUF2007 domain-containing protein [Oscillatoria amoena NRMC-F 0135]